MRLEAKLCNPKLACSSENYLYLQQMAKLEFDGFLQRAAPISARPRPAPWHQAVTVAPTVEMGAGMAALGQPAQRPHLEAPSTVKQADATGSQSDGQVATMKAVATPTQSHGGSLQVSPPISPALAVSDAASAVVGIDRQSSAPVESILEQPVAVPAKGVVDTEAQQSPTVGTSTGVNIDAQEDSVAEVVDSSDETFRASVGAPPDLATQADTVPMGCCKPTAMPEPCAVEESPTVAAATFNTMADEHHSSNVPRPRTIPVSEESTPACPSITLGVDQPPAATFGQQDSPVLSKCLASPTVTSTLVSPVEQIGLPSDALAPLRSCAHCDKKGMRFPRCGRCKIAFYCSRKCQVDHWDCHEVACDHHLQATAIDSAKNAAQLPFSEQQQQQQSPPEPVVSAQFLSSEDVFTEWGAYCKAALGVTERSLHSSLYIVYILLPLF